MYVFTANAVLNDYLRVSGQCSRIIGKLWVGCWVDFFWMGVPLPPCHVSFLFFFLWDKSYCLSHNISYKPTENVGKYLKGVHLKNEGHWGVRNRAK